MWISLAGKICVNPKIREKLFNNSIHLDIFNHLSKFKDKPELEVMASFFGSWCYNYEKACEWCEK